MPASESSQYKDAEMVSAENLQKPKDPVDSSFFKSTQENSSPESGGLTLGSPVKGDPNFAPST